MMIGGIGWSTRLLEKAIVRRPTRELAGTQGQNYVKGKRESAIDTWLLIGGHRHFPATRQSSPSIPRPQPPRFSSNHPPPLSP